MKMDLPIEAIVDCKTLFNLVAKDAKSSERRLKIDVLAIKEIYDIGELTKIGWIPGSKNPADALTKTVLMSSSPLYRILKYKIFDKNPE